jgi:hypothetical protein
LVLNPFLVANMLLVMVNLLLTTITTKNSNKNNHNSNNANNDNNNDNGSGSSSDCRTKKSKIPDDISDDDEINNEDGKNLKHLQFLDHFDLI